MAPDPDSSDEEQARAASRGVPLYKRSSSHFQVGDRERGDDYHREGRVEVQVDGSRARARVRGTEEDFYRVGVDWSLVEANRRLHVFCECRRFSDRRPCKHVWATLLALAETGPQNQPAGGDRVGLRKDPPSQWNDLGISTAQPEARLSGTPKRSRPRRPGRQNRRRGRKGPAWRDQLSGLADTVDGDGTPSASGIRFLINSKASQVTKGLVLDVFGPRRGAEEGSMQLQRTSLEPEVLEQLLYPDHDDGGNGRATAVVTALPVDPPRPKGRHARGRRGKQAPRSGGIRSLSVPPPLYEIVLPHLCEEQTLGWWDGHSRTDLYPLTWDDGQPWHLVLKMEFTAHGTRLFGSLERDEESVLITEPPLVASSKNGSGVVLFPDCLVRLETQRAGDAAWIELLREDKEIAIPKEDLEEAFAALFEIPGLPAIDAPDELQLTEETSPLEPRLFLEPDPASVDPDPPLLARLSFVYGELEARVEDPRESVIDWRERTLLRRDMEGEHQALVRLLEAGVRPVASGKGHNLELSPTELPGVVEPLLTDGWAIEVRGTSLRAAGSPSLKVESGVDWFALSGSTDFAGDRVELREILEAVRRGDSFVELSDGSRGLLPEALVETVGSLADLAHEDTDDGLRFLSSQALLVDAQLAVMPTVDIDREFSRLREKLRSFESIKPKKQPRGFKGELRSYQREGLGWLEFLREFGLGGVLADDMGLGKTVQLLALLKANRTKAKTTGLPWLVVAPRSLVYNWIEEVERFTPTTKVVEYRGPGREKLHGEFAKYDLLVTTYGTLRRDIDVLRKVEFDTVVLDEAQAIKNRDSQSAKASRLLRARNRLALTGTPIENHLGELGSIFEFLNPGLLGSMPRLEALSGRDTSDAELERVAAGIRPFILRRTKGEVLEDLPPKTEQVLYCTLRPGQREIYDKLRAGYQASLLGEVEEKGVGGSAIQVLEALLRLRQVACHPGLVNDEWEDAGSAKLEALFEQVEEVLSEGHKVLVFSQFTSLLAYVRQELDTRGVDYAYLDGKTKNRGEVVERFQTDESCNLFLISLKAGGLGLNLTAAGYVFLLDPWWNPAVEAQAIGRAHRIGQTQPVFSYRLIAQDTVEEKILDLQSSKKKLAGAILEGDGISMRDLTADDLRVLLS